MDIKVELMQLDFITIYHCITRENKHASYSFKRWRTDSSDIKIIKMVKKANQESEVAEKKFIDTMNKLNWKFQAEIKRGDNDDD